MRFHDRSAAGLELARELEGYRGRSDVVVLGLPRGGVPVAYEVARHLGAPLDVFCVRKLGAPGHEELAMGAIATGGVRVLNQRLISRLGLPGTVVARVAERERPELERRERIYRHGRPRHDLGGRTVILVDDGLATGATMRAAVAALRKLAVRRVVVAVPVAAPDTCQSLGEEVDEIVCVQTPDPFVAVGMWYDDFDQTSDEEVGALLDRAAAELGGGVEASP